MAKIRHNNFIDTLSDLSKSASSQGVIQLYAEDESLSGRWITIGGNRLAHFGTTGYLGLEQDLRIKQAAADAIMKYGTQFPLSKTYISHPLYKSLEEKLFEMYGLEVLVTKNSTLGHIGVIPSIVRDEDAIILDHQVHWSVQNAVQLIKSRGVPVEMIRHSDLNMLEDKLKSLGQNAQKVWYFADGVYSMFGDVAPIDELKNLCAKYPQLHLYFDDVHGMSWIGKNGTGYVIDQYKTLPENVIVFTTLSKSFGASGSTMVTSNKELLERVRAFGGPLTFSAQLEPASVAAAIASATLHLSAEINSLQVELQERVKYCNQLISQTDLPLIDHNQCPVFYVGTGAPKAGYNFTNKLYKNGCYVNMGLFPAVPVKKTGVRFTISLHNQLSDIEHLVETMNHHYAQSIEEEGYSLNQVRLIFKLPELAQTKNVSQRSDQLKVLEYSSISQVDQKIWNECMVGRNVFDSTGLKFLESLFSNNEEKEHNWSFRYLLIVDESDQVVLATFFTLGMWKEDMLAPKSVSQSIEEKRQNDRYLHTSKLLSLGSLFTEGSHLFINRSHEHFADACNLLLKHIEKLQVEFDPDTTALRDFDMQDAFMQDAITKHGFVKVTLPEVNLFKMDQFLNDDNFVNSLSARSKKHFRQEVEPYLNRLDIEIKECLNTEESQRAFELYGNVWQNNLAFNSFRYPIKMIEEMNQCPGWEFILASDPTSESMVGVMFCYNNHNSNYIPSLVGMDYDFTKEFSIYRLLLYQTILRAKQLGVKLVDFGYSANFEKHKMGAEQKEICAYLQAKDNYSLEMLEFVNQ